MLILSSGGSTWSQTSAPYSYWNAIAIDASGIYLAAVIWNSGIYISTSGIISKIYRLNLLTIIIGGNAWSQTSAPNGYWAGITSDTTGTYLAAVQYNGDNGLIYISSSGF